MTTTLLLAGSVAAVAVGSLIWAFLRPTKIIFPERLNDWLESEEFRTWLGEDDHWFMWGREMDGRYFVETLGYFNAWHIRKKAFEKDTGS
ncbi:hypothetical protein [Sphingomonas sp.]|uniref:hypothetical protein n=1 Tax=Sphingomonas sp. TaxID=28214 RepID=UPI0017CA0A6E|nr:hypothetical protein [Sphingomonas sp.]MBA3512678.1 hypothetical protein [Sphingomonas sp.]